LATAQRLEQMAVDDALDLLDLLMAKKLLARAERASTRERLRSLPRLTAASATLAAVVQVVLEVTATSETAASGGWDIVDETDVAAVSLVEMWTRIEQVAPRHQVRAALETVVALAPSAAEDADADWRAELIKRFATVRPFLPLLLDVITFGAVAGGHRVLAAAPCPPPAQKGVRQGDCDRPGHGFLEAARLSSPPGRPRRAESD
jgi:hypothetical protein